MNSSFVKMSSQHCPLCLIFVYLSILRLSCWQSKYDEMHLSTKNAAPTTIGTAKKQSILNLLYHRAKSWIFCAVFTVDGMVATQSDLPGDLSSWVRELLFQRCCATSGSLVAAWVGCLSDEVWLVALNFSNGKNTNFSHFQKQYHTFISNLTTPESNVTKVDSNFTKHIVKYHAQVHKSTCQPTALVEFDKSSGSFSVRDTSTHNTEYVA